MQWDAGPNAGFTSGHPWMKINENYKSINAEAQMRDPDSVFHYYRRLIELRKTYPVFRDGVFSLLLPDDEDLWVYTRTLDGVTALVLANFHCTQREIPLDIHWDDWELLISNLDSAAPARLRAYEARIYLCKNGSK